MTPNELHCACEYLNKDRIMHGPHWRVDPGKLQAALEFAQAEAIRLELEQMREALLRDSKVRIGEAVRRDYLADKTDDELADQIAADIGPVETLSRDEALALARAYFGDESGEVVDGIAEALYRSYRGEDMP